MDDMICITGSKGFIGRNLRERLPNARQYNRNDTLNLQGIDTVIHLACDADSRNSNTHILQSITDNIGIFSQVLDEAIQQKVKRFIYISSIEAETEHNVYAIGKATNEKILRIAAKEYGFEYVIIRPCNAYGKYMDLKDTKRNVVANFLQAIKKKQPLPIINGERMYPFTHVRVLVDNIVDSLTKNTNETIRVGSTTYLSIYDIACLLEGITETWDWVKKQK